MKKTGPKACTLCFHNLPWYPIRLGFAALLAVVFFSSCNKSEPTLFEALPASETGIDFQNTVVENDSINVLDYMNIYTGAGVAAGDVDNDGLVDLFFSANRITCRLFLNKGGMKFEDITEKAGVKTDRWCTGTTFIDINQDGWLDIYVCVSGNSRWGSTANLLFINQGKNAQGSITFLEKAAEYGLADPRLTLNATILDYDLDGDLDLFLITNPADQLISNVNNVIEQKLNGAGRGADILYRNDGGHFTDVSKAAGITKDGYSLGAAVADFNEDGWPDIYVSNDFISSDILYLNNGDGTFRDDINRCLRHSSFASMGCDAADVNNDGLTDIFTLDMLPEGNFRRKMLIPPVNIDKFEMTLGKGYLPQYTRNNLQLNMGEHKGAYQFSEIALLAGIAATDWSWAPLFADFDLDGDKDLLITNGFYRDLGNLDYINYQFLQRSSMGNEQSKRDNKLSGILTLESVPLQNYLFENNEDLTFSNRSDNWGLTEKGFSNGACFADLDNDGDLEIVINDFNAPAKLLKNNAREHAQTSAGSNFLALKLAGTAPNLSGIGAKVFVYTSDGARQFQEMNPVRGYESCMEARLFFGLGAHEKADSVRIIWPDGTLQTELQIPANQTFVISKKGTPQKKREKDNATTAQIFQETTVPGLEFDHTENYFIDFKTQILLPHQHSRECPAMAVGDVNGDHLDDLYISGSKDSRGALYIQHSTGVFTRKDIHNEPTTADETAALFFDADGDGDADLYIAKGGSEYPEGAAELQDEIWVNNGSGQFSKNLTALPDTRFSAGCIAANDYDYDGDLDLFVGGRVKPGEYPKSPRSILLTNETEKGLSDGVKFADMTPDHLKHAGMITDALWADLDKNGFYDLILTGEYMSVLISDNQKGTLSAFHPATTTSDAGWWNKLAAADFDGDGDLDLLAGNLGLNTRFRATADHPLSVLFGDLDKNGAIDPIICQFEENERYIFPTRDELASQIPAMKRRFPNYSIFAKSTFRKSFRPDELLACDTLNAYCLESSYFKNDGGRFTRQSLPLFLQFAPVQDFLIADFNRDGYLDFLAAGNFYGSDYTTGRLDAGTGSLFLGDGKGSFTYMNNQQSGFWALADVRNLVILKRAKGQALVLTGNNNGKMDIHLWK